MQINSAKDLSVYKKEHALSMRIFEMSKRFPVEERWGAYQTDPTVISFDMYDRQRDSPPASFLISDAEL